jgi:hypothetical protein
MFWKKKRMIDVGEMQKRGMVRAPAKKSESGIIASKNGFVELKPSASETAQSPSQSSDSGFLGFFGDSSSTPSASAEQFSTESNGYSKREVDAKIEELDNKIYKLEQRIEVLERKNGVGQGW